VGGKEVRAVLVDGEVRKGLARGRMQRGRGRRG
jgi:hypothetical protein